MDKNIQNAWYEALHQMMGSLTSDEAADILIAAGLTKTKNRATVSAHVRGCLNPNRPGFFKASELILFTKHNQCFQAIAFLNEQVGCMPPVLKSGELSCDSVPTAGGLDMVKLEELRQQDAERRSKPQRYNQTLFSQDVAES